MVHKCAVVKNFFFALVLHTSIFFFNLLCCMYERGENNILSSWDLYAVSLCSVMHYFPLVGIQNYSRKHRYCVGLLGLVSAHRGLVIARATVIAWIRVTYLCLSFLSAGSRENLRKGGGNSVRRLEFV